jgi:hypothetical protein
MNSKRDRICLKEKRHHHVIDFNSRNFATKFNECGSIRCDFREACRLLAGASPENAGKIRNAVSFDQSEWRYGEAADPVVTIDAEATTTEMPINAISVFNLFNYLAQIDAKALAIIFEIVKHRRISKRKLAEILNVAPGTVSKAVVDAIIRHPELQSFFKRAFDNICAAKKNPFRSDRAELTPLLPGFSRLFRKGGD